MSTFVAEINKLKNIQQNLEKNENMLVEQISRIDDSSEICDLFKEREDSRTAQVKKLQNDVKDIMSPLRKVTNLVRGDNIGSIDLKLVKKEMITIQKNIQNLKNNTKTSLELLQQEEERLSEDMQTFKQRMEQLNKTTVSFPKKYVAKRISATTPENISQEVKDFLEFVTASGGHENGWTVDDHNLFLKARGKTKDVAKLAEMLHALLPDISEEEIIAHEKWFENYTELKEKQKHALKNWRENKLKANKNTPTKTTTSVERSLSKSFSSCLDKEERQQKISAWKAEKRVQVMKQHEQKLQEELKQKQLMQQQKQKHEQIKADVNNWRNIKKTAEEAEKTQKALMELHEREIKAAKANKLIKQFQSQDEILIQRKIRLREVRPKSAEMEVVKIKHEAPRDPERLFKPTKQWILRRYGSDNNGESKNKMPLQAIPKLGIPEWRRQI